ncbi:MAG TPA: M20/M25/M40 family metallo-hydrolase [Gemmatimonadales bacterium]
MSRPVSMVSVTLLMLVVSPATAQSVGLDPRITALLDTVSTERLGQLVTTLAGFETRNTLSDTASPSRGIGAARRWIFDQFRQASPRLQVGYDEHVIPAGGRITREVLLRNVVAVLPGRTPRRVYVSGHYDTVARRDTASGLDWTAGNNPAPGANDDGSGTALVLELAGVLARSGIEFDATLVFIALAGEEQGLIGATRHARKAAEEGTAIEAVLNNDIVGGVAAGNGLTDSRTVRVFAEGPEDSPSRQLARYIRDVAARYVPSHTVRPLARHDRFGRGGDHSAFNQVGYPAVRLTEAMENYSRQHTVNDTPEGVSPEYLARNARVNAAALASLALAPPAPRVTSATGSPMLGRGPSGYDAALRWQPSPGAVGYRVVWREAWAPEWRFGWLIARPDTAAMLPDVSIDDYVFGIVAVGPDGHESLVAAYINPPRRPPPAPARP